MTIISNTDVLSRTSFNGWINIDGEKHSVSFSVFAGADCNLKIDLEPVPVELYIKLGQCMGRPGELLKKISLTGKADSGYEFESDTIMIIECNIVSTKAQCSLTHNSATVTKKTPEGVYTENPWARFWLKGFQSFRNPVIQTKLGQLSVDGELKNVTKDSVSGNITIQADTVNVDGDWFSKADDFLTFLMGGLDFCHGGGLQRPLFYRVCSKESKTTFYACSGWEPDLAAIHFMGQKDYVKALVERYESEFEFPNMLWTATGWLHAGSTINEVKFLTMMTALETIVENVAPKTDTTILAKAEFQDIEKALKAALSEISLDAEPKEIFASKISGMNTRSISHKIEAMKRHYKLSDDVFSKKTVRQLMGIRNKITHSGLVPERVDLWQNILIIREMIVMIVFAEIGYSGPYESYAEGYKTVHPIT